VPEDNSKFEDHLKEFRPLPPDGLPATDLARREARFRFWWAWAFSGAALLIAAFLLASFQSHRVEDRAISSPVELYAPPLTFASANTKLFNSLSTNEALDELAFPAQPQLPAGKISALDVLGKEKTGL
jgi:hypothetical protein